MGLNSEMPGSRPEPKADAQPRSHWTYLEVSLEGRVKVYQPEEVEEEMTCLQNLRP